MPTQCICTFCIMYLVPPVLDVLTRRPDSGGLPHLLALKSLEMLTAFNYIAPFASIVGMSKQSFINFNIDLYKTNSSRHNSKSRLLCSNQP